MEINSDYIVDKLNHLIAIAEDGKEGFANAANHIDDDELKISFMELSHERANYATQLRKEVRILTGDVESKGGGPIGMLHRIWIDLKAIFTGGDRDAIINACITGEEFALNEYQEALGDGNISENHKQLISEHLLGINQSLARLLLKVKR